MQENFVLGFIRPDFALHARYASSHINAHTGWATDKHARSPTKVALKATEHKGNVWAAVFGVPALFLGADGWQEGKAHEVLLYQSRGCWEAKVKVLLSLEGGWGGDLERKGGLIFGVDFCRWRGEDRGRRKSGDVVFVFAPELSFLFWVAAGFVPNQGRVPLAGDALEGVVNFIVEKLADGAGWGWRDDIATGGYSFCRSYEELAVDRFGGSEFPAYSELFLKPLHSIGPFESPDNLNPFSQGFAVPHLLNQI